MALAELETTNQWTESLIGLSAITIPKLILEGNSDIAAIRLKTGHRSVWHGPKERAVFDGDDLAITNHLMMRDGGKAWILQISYKGFSAQDVELAKKEAITIPAGCGYFVGNKQTLAFIGSVPQMNEEGLFEIIGRTMKLSNVNHEWQAEQISTKRKHVWLTTADADYIKIVGSIGI